MILQLIRACEALKTDHGDEILDPKVAEHQELLQKIKELRAQYDTMISSWNG
jgi:hypothetical protein